MSTRQKFIIIFSALVLLVFASAITYAEFPDKPITIIVPYSAGGGNDTGARLMVPYLQEELGVSIVVTNKPGGGGQVGSQLLLSKKADGYTLLMASFPATITGILLADAPYTIDDFDYICGQQEDPRMLITSSNAPFQTLEEFISYAKENPGLITVSNAGTGSSSWFSALAFELMADIEIVKVPFGGSAKALAAFLGGHVMAQAPTLSYIYGPHKEGKAVGLGLMSEERHPDFPEVPTFKEQGFDLIIASVRGVLAPKGLPEDVYIKLVDAFTAVMNNPDFLEKANNVNLLINHKEGKDFEKYAKDQFEIFTQLVKEMEN